ncbi:MAG: flagellar hook capping FlgD N-terminal domain-containing protein [Bacillota bacterium]
MSVEGITQATNNLLNQDDTTADSSKNLGKDEFLELLVTQLKNQDPLDPMDNKEFISQTAQFTSLEQMKNMNTNLESALKMQDLTQTSSLIGKEVELVDSESGEEISGQVEKIVMDEDDPLLVVNGNEYELGSVSEVLG